ncbi:unannotated protein [freshwater metagenome]|uniref:Unannotated protein n=1 Tax=freshwater metagenome TaxID=449393 RepID=A0A6J6MV90_9ZZZZ|nr:hypothetical protein [Actinomycetota bacterium]MSZ05954.1 hypothetical protein [Actinomycetota bacterium]
MQLTNRLLNILSNVSILIGVALGMGGIVRGGSLFIAAGTAGVALKARSRRRFDFYFPLIIAVALFVLAVALPHGR